MSKVKYGFWPSFRPLGLSLPKSALSLVYVYYLAPFNPRTLLSITACQHHIYDVRGNFVILLFKTRAISYKALNSNIPGSDSSHELRSRPKIPVSHMQKKNSGSSKISHFSSPSRSSHLQFIKSSLPSELHGETLKANNVEVSKK